MDRESTELSAAKECFVKNSNKFSKVKATGSRGYIQQPFRH